MLARAYIAIISDIHGNAPALKAVLADARERNVQSFIVAGDLVMNGPKPAEALPLLRGLEASTLVGNTDLEVVADVGPVASWTRRQVGKVGVEYLRALPTKYRVTPPGGRTPFDDLLVVHSSPRSCNDLLVLEPHPLGTTFTHPTPMGDAEAMLGSQRADLIVFGHIHYASSGTVRGQRLASTGSVGFPFDGDPGPRMRWPRGMVKTGKSNTAASHTPMRRSLATSSTRGCLSRHATPG